jgi:hypothetical protein
MPLSITRRSVLQRVGAVAAFARTCSALQNIARAQTMSGEDYWDLVRRPFIFPEHPRPHPARHQWRCLHVDLIKV